MILAFIEDGTLELFKTEADACSAFEGIDAESEFVTFYNDAGDPLKPEFTVPNTQGRILFFLKWSKSGQYHLVHEKNKDPLWLALLETSHLETNDDFKTLADLKQHLENNGVQVNNPDID